MLMLLLIAIMAPPSAMIFWPGRKVISAAVEPGLSGNLTSISIREKVFNSS
jgi:hypothetical protein